MAVEKDESGTTFAGGHIEIARLLTVASALALEVNMPGMRHSRGSMMNVAKAACGSSKRTKKGVLGDLVAFIQTVHPTYAPGPSVARALGN